MNIHEIEKLTQYEIESMAEEKVDVKGHDVYLVDLGDWFGYSALVCADGHHLKYANDYQLHHRNKTREELRDWYIEKMGQILFTEDELAQRSDNYDERQRKAHYLHNYYSDRRLKVSMFGNAPDWFDDKKNEMVFSFVGFGYYFDAEFVKHMDELKEAFEQANDPLRDYESAKSAFKYEMYNHEYPINWQGNWDVLNCFSKYQLEYDHKNDDQNIDFYFDQLGFSDEIRRAYRDAVSEVMHRYVTCD